MNKILIIAVMVPFISFSTLLISQSAALDRDPGSGKIWSVNRELFQDCLRHQEKIRVKNNRHALHRGHTFAMLQQSDLLQELLTPGVIRHGSNKMTVEVGKPQRISCENSHGTGLLDELIVEQSMR